MKHLKFLSSQQSVTMTTKRGLITDSFKVVKKKKRGGKQEKSPTPPPPQTGGVLLEFTECDVHTWAFSGTWTPDPKTRSVSTASLLEPEVIERRSRWTASSDWSLDRQRRFLPAAVIKESPPIGGNMLQVFLSQIWTNSEDKLWIRWKKTTTKVCFRH